MAFTYDTATDLGKIRLEIGDTDSTDALLQDAEVQVKLTLRGDVLTAAADCCDLIAAKFARGYDFETDQQAFKRSQRVKHYRELGASLRSRASSLGHIGVTRVDGYSEDIDFQETSSSPSTGRVRAGYTDPDLPD